MRKDISQPAKHKTWEQVNRNEIPPEPSGKPYHVIKGTLKFKLKRLPDRSPLKYKCCYCVRGYLQTAGVDYF